MPESSTPSSFFIAFSTNALSVSISRTLRSASANTSAISEPIMPAPHTPIFWIVIHLLRVGREGQSFGSCSGGWIPARAARGRDDDEGEEPAPSHLSSSRSGPLQAGPIRDPRTHVRRTTPPPHRHNAG